MNDSREKSKSIEFDISLDGTDFQSVKCIDITEAEAMERAITALCVCIKELNRLNIFFSSSEESKFYIRANPWDIISKNEEFFKEAFQLYNLLTTKQKELLSFLYKEINQHLIAHLQGISLNTLYSHRKSIYRKLGFKEHADLVVWCDSYLFDILKAC